MIDFGLAALPWKIIWQLQITRVEKIGIGAALSLGLLYVSHTSCSYFILPLVFNHTDQLLLFSAGVASIVKAVYLLQLKDVFDFTCELSLLILWRTIQRLNNNQLTNL